MRVLVTGSAGFVGSHVFESMQAKEKIGIVRDVKREAPAEPGVVLARGDLRDAAFVNRVVTEYDPDIVLHLAAAAIVNQGVLNPTEMYSSNVTGTVNLLEACKRLNRKDLYFHVFSSDKSLGQQKDSKEDAQYPFADLGPYEQSKMMQEVLGLKYAKHFNVLITRCANIYGPGDSASTGRIVPNNINRGLAGTNPKAYNRDTRQYVYIDDVVSAVKLLVNRSETGIWHIGSPDILNSEQVCQTIVDEVNRVQTESPRIPVEVEMATDDVQAANKFLWYIHDQYLNYDKLKALSWAPQIGFKEGIRRTVEWFRSQNAST